MALTLTRQKGFTIVESLIALVILLVGFLALSMLHIGATRANTLARGNTLATILAYGQIDRFQRLGYSNVSAGNDSPVLDGLGFSRSWTATDNGNSKTVIVQVSWKDQWGAHAINFAAIVRR